MDEKTKEQISPLLYDALIQGKAYRALAVNLKKTLSLYDLSILEWKVLSIIFYCKNTTNKQIADALYVEMPLITKIIQRLIIRSLIKIQSKKEDNRYKLLSITTKGKKLLVSTIEEVRSNTLSLFKGVSMNELQTYVKVLEVIVLNSKKQI